MSAYTKPSCARVPRRQRMRRSASGLSARALKQCSIHSENGLRARARERGTRRAAHHTRLHARVGPSFVKRARCHFNKGDGDGGGDDVVHGERAERQRHRVRDVEAREAADTTPPARAHGSARRLLGLARWAGRTCSAAAAAARSTGPRAAAATTRHATVQATPSIRRTSARRGAARAPALSPDLAATRGTLARPRLACGCGCALRRQLPRGAAVARVGQGGARSAAEVRAEARRRRRPQPASERPPPWRERVGRAAVVWPAAKILSQIGG